VVTILILSLLIAGVSAALANSYVVCGGRVVERVLANASLLMALAVFAQALLYLMETPVGRL
jgi:hypothetical protein